MATSQTVSSGAIFTISAGQTDKNGFILPDGKEVILSGGTASKTTISGNTVDGPGMQVVAGGVAINATVLQSGQQIISAGGSTTGTTVSAGGSQYVSSGGSASATVVSSGGLQTIDSSGIASATSVFNGGEEDILSGGSASATIVRNGGVAIVSNGGTIDGAIVSGGTVEIQSGGTLGSDGLLFARSGSQLTLDPGSVVSGGVTASAGMNVNNLLDLTSGATSGVISGLGSQITGMDSVRIDGGATWEFAGNTTLDSSVALVNRGVLSETTGDNLTINGSITGGGSIILDTTPLTLNGAVASAQTVHFTGAGEVLSLGDPSEFAASIAGFGNHDTIDLTGISSASVQSEDFDTNTGVLTISLTSGGPILLDFNGSFTGKFFHAIGDGTSGTLITENNSACYVRGTLIRTERGEVPVEDLQIGDLLPTFSGALQPIRWIGRRSYGGRFLSDKKHILPVRIQAGALADGVPRRDLWISPHHAMYLDGVLVEAKNLINGVSIVQENVEQVDYIHIELATHQVIWAEAAASETFIDDDSRAMFHNAQEFAALYPEESWTPAEYCAPRLNDGYELEAIRQGLAARAGIPKVGRAAALRGFVDLAGPSEVRGWAQDPAHPEVPVCLDVLAGGCLLGQVLAHQYREDLERVGLGSGRHAFVFVLPAGSSGLIEVRRSADQQSLPAAEGDRRAA